MNFIFFDIGKDIAKVRLEMDANLEMLENESILRMLVDRFLKFYHDGMLERVNTFELQEE